MFNISHLTFVKKVFVWIRITDHQPFCAIPVPSHFYHVNVVFVVVNLMFMNVVSKDWVFVDEEKQNILPFCSSFCCVVGIETGNDFFICSFFHI